MLHCTRTLKILIINTVPTEKNGITNVIFNYLSAMNVQGYLFDYVSLNDPDEPFKQAISRIGGRLFVISRTMKTIVSYVTSLKRIIKDNKYDIVHIHGNSHTVVIELLAARLARCSVRIVHAHSTRCNSIALHNFLALFFNMLCTNRIACGRDAGLFMFGRYPFSVMNNGVDVGKFAFNIDSRVKIRNKLGWDHHNKVIGHVGYFTELKNQSFIVDVFDLLYKMDQNYRLVLIGDGPLKKKVKEKLDSNDLDCVSCLTGNVDNVNEYLNAMDVIVMPSLFEGLPLTLIEQQANGLQCFISDSITREVDKTGNVVFLSLQDGAHVWAEKIKDIDCNNDREARSKRGIVDISHWGYNITEEAKKLRDYYRDICNKRNN